MAVNLSPVGGVAAQFFDNSGNVLTGGKLYTYAAGTTTPAVTYTTNVGVTAHSNPIVLDAAGRVPSSGEIWLTDGISYKFVLKDSNDVQIATWDNIIGINSNFVNYSLQTDVQTATQGQTLFTLTGVTYQPATNSLAVFVNGSRQIITLNYIETSSTSVTFVDGLNVGDVVEFITATSATGNATTAANVSYNEGGTGAITRTVEAKLQEFVSVLDFGADPTGVTDSTIAFTDAIATGKRVWIPNGTYIGANIDLPSGTVIEGETRSNVILNVNDDDSGFFTYATSYNFRISNVTAGVVSGKTNARFIKQTNLAAYTAYCTFQNIETRAELLYSYEGFFIFTEWQGCRDGYIGSPGATHVFIKSVPVDGSQSNQTNICQVLQCQIFSCTGTLGAIYLEWGVRWVIRDTDFELNNTYAIKALGIRGLEIDGCWFEQNNTAEVISCANSTAPNAQGTIVNISNSWYYAHANNILFVDLGGASRSSIVNVACAVIPVGCYLTNASTLDELYGVYAFSGPGANDFISAVAYRTNITLNAPSIINGALSGDTTISSGTVNGTNPASTGINVNAGSAGKTYLITWSFNNATGDSTASSLYMIRCGYSGDNYSAVKVSGSTGGVANGCDVLTFSVVSSILYIAAAAAGNGRFGIVGN